MNQKCEHGWHDGSCCCNCKNQVELFKHPMNTIHKGSILESTGLFACTVSLDCDSQNRGIIFEGKHGMCELHVNRFQEENS